VKVAVVLVPLVLETVEKVAVVLVPLVLETVERVVVEDSVRVTVLLAVDEYVELVVIVL